MTRAPLPSVLAGLLIASLLGAPAATAHPVSYVGIGPVVFPVGHFVPLSAVKPMDTVVLTINDALADRIGGTWCQYVGTAYSWCYAFCHTTVITAWLDWDPNYDVFVWIDGGLIALGTPTACGAPTSGSVGTVSHVP